MSSGVKSYEICMTDFEVLSDRDMQRRLCDFCKQLKMQESRDRWELKNPDKRKEVATNWWLNNPDKVQSVEFVNLDLTIQTIQAVTSFI